MVQEYGFVIVHGVVCVGTHTSAGDDGQSYNLGV